MAATESAQKLFAAHVGETEIILMDILLNGTKNGLQLAQFLREERLWADVAQPQSQGDVDKTHPEQGEAARRDLVAAQHYPTAAVVFGSVCASAPWSALCLC
jgi:hypothetical protein